LHGYQQSGDRIFRKLEPSISSDCTVLAPNGLFPLPELKDRKVSVGFSWYFYNHLTDEYFIDMRAAETALAAMIEKLGLASRKLVIIGFSQGGYLGPVLARKVNASQVIGIGARYLVDEIEGSFSYRADGIHGGKDEVVDPILSQKAHEAMLARGAKGTFTILPETGHRIDKAVQEEVSKLLRKD
jgi:predicted esterase